MSVKPDTYYAKLCKKESEPKFDPKTLAAQVDTYLASGKKITTVPVGVGSGASAYAPVVSKRGDIE